ncbi:MAG: carboxypeptidase-like regulatory domain-containing protein [Marinilabiliaceae bacterium]|nr:carboxypeptidase-like regulatory domain-containing protein [Marinilabiliaceae bacterium]
MKNTKFKSFKSFILAVIFFFSLAFITQAKELQKNNTDSASTLTIQGEVVDYQSGEPLTFATLNILGTNIATVCNSEGAFLIKIPNNLTDKSVSVSFIGYNTKEIKVSELKPDKNKIKLDGITVSLAEVNVFPKDPDYLIRAVLEKRNQNYMDIPLIMTSFYRETIKMGRTYVSLSEAVVDVFKQSYSVIKPDFIKLHKARKSADYSKLDTLTFKLMGGPYSALMLDMMKDPYMVLSDDIFKNLDFSLHTITRINDRLIYVIDFKQIVSDNIPLYSGKLYIDSESMAITSASYSLNVKNRTEASNMFIKKKPIGASVYPTEATYLVHYTQKNNKWVYSYSRGQINFKVNWKKKLFNTNYLATIEMATTNWKETNEKTIKPAERLKPNVILQDKATGFADNNFWGEYNVIEPEKSIETAIKKIKRTLDNLK